MGTSQFTNRYFPIFIFSNIGSFKMLFFPLQNAKIIGKNYIILYYVVCCVGRVEIQIEI